MKTFVFPGQGSQKAGMGGPLFDRFGELTALADNVLGYSIKQLCLEDPDKRLGQTQYTQPALFAVNAMMYLDKVSKTGAKPDYLAGHSLGEYNALFAAGVFDFETGLRLVQKRGSLMGRTTGGGMAAIIGLSAASVDEIIARNKLESIQVANYNSPSQVVVSGPGDDIKRLGVYFETAGARYIQLNVSGAFHSRFMNEAKEEFKRFVDAFTFSAPAIPVISNVTAQPYEFETLKTNLVNQITGSVKWTDTIRYLMGEAEMEFEEIGPGTVLTGLIRAIRKEAAPLPVGGKNTMTKSQEQAAAEKIKSSTVADETGRQRNGGVASSVQRPSRTITAESLGNDEFKKDYNLKYAYVTGSMYRGISSTSMVAKIAKAGMLGFFGTGGLTPSEIEQAIQDIGKELPNGETYGINLLHNPAEPNREETTVDLLLRYGVKVTEASAFMEITPSLVRLRAHGLRRDGGRIVVTNRIVAKISRPEVAEAFLSPAPERICRKLAQEGRITSEQEDLLKEVSMADDLCVEADSGGHTDGGVAYALMPAIIRLRDEMMTKYAYAKRIRVGAAGGIGTPEAAAAAVILGADFILTGSINQCTVEAAVSDKVKDMLQQMNVQDTEYAPAGDMFELGARVQVLKKGVFFPARANKLYDLYRQSVSLDDIDEKTKKQIQERYFKRSFEEIYEECKSYYPQDQIERAERNPKHKMAMIFKWYFGHSTRLALRGIAGHEVDYQVHCGPALGAFNSWIKGSKHEDWRNRHVDEIALKLLSGAADVLNQRFQRLHRADQ